ncbi:MAG: lysophospholipid acyltransferase family protein [Devosiaceae bacterium]
MKPTFSHRAENAAMHLVRGFVLLLGIKHGSRFMGWVWGTFAPHMKRHNRALSQLEASMPELSKQERDQTIGAMWKGLGQTFAEGLVLDRLGDEPDFIHFENPDILEQARQPKSEGGKPPGLLLISMHSGNWEAFGVNVRNQGVHAAALYQSVANPLVDEVLRRHRTLYWQAGMITKGSSSMKRVVGLLRQGDGVAILADHRVSGSDVSVPFFGKLAPSTSLPASLALKTGAQLILGRCKRIGLVRYSIEIAVLPAEATGDHKADVERVTAAIHAQLEDWIRERPHEWMWAHRRWSREVRKPDPIK